MRDEANVFAQLGSHIHGSLTHISVVLGRALEADVSAVRLFEPAASERSAMVYASRLDLSRDQDHTLQSWPAEEGSLFALAQEYGCAR